MNGPIARLLDKGSASYQVTTLALGAGLGQLAVLLVSPILTRLYTPEEFGVLAVYSAIFGILVPIVGLRYELAIPMPRTQGSAANVLLLTLICVLGMSSLIAFLTFLFGPSILQWSNTPALVDYAWLVPLGVLLAGTYQALNYWAVRRKMFLRIAQTKLQQGGGMAITQVLLGSFQSGAVGLIAGLVIGHCAGLVTFLKYTRHEVGWMRSRVRWERVRRHARRYRGFPLLATWSALANTGSYLLPLILFSALYSPVVAGVYLLAERVVKMPMSLLAGSVGQVFYSRAADSRAYGSLDHLVLRTFSFLLTFSMIPVCVFAYFAPALFAFVFGEEWRISGEYVQWMTPWLIIEFVTAPISTAGLVLEKQVGNFLTQAVQFIIRVGAVLIGAQYGSDEMIIAYALSGVFSYGLRLAWVFRVSSVDLLSVARVVTANVVTAIALLALLNIFATG